MIGNTSGSCIITGNLTNKVLEDTIASLVQAEALGLIIDPVFQTKNIQYWKLYLQPQFEIPDATVDLDGSWPILARYLIAKLVVHSYITALIRTFVGSAVSTGSTDTDTGAVGSIKKIETGPSNAEWYNSADSLEVILKTGTGGISPYDQLAKDICMSAQRLKVFLPICGQKNQVIVPLIGRIRSIFTSPANPLHHE